MRPNSRDENGSDWNCIASERIRHEPADKSAVTMTMDIIIRGTTPITATTPIAATHTTACR